jgi:hypothetical protein
MEPDHDSRRYVKRWKKSELSMDNFTLFRDGLPLNDPFMTWEKYYCEMVMGKEDCLKEEICRSIIRKLDRETTGLSNRKYILKELEEKNRRSSCADGRLLSGGGDKQAVYGRNDLGSHA